MKKYLYILTSLFISATIMTGCSEDDDDNIVIPTPTPAQESDVVDLGLPSGTLWAKANLGAKEEYGTGNLYAWGETYTKGNFSSSNYFDASCTIIRSNITGTEYDAAKMSLGGQWVMPTEEQFKELFSECKVSRTTLNEKAVIKLVGPNEQVLYLPEISAEVEGAATLYDEYTDEKGKTVYAKFENVYASYWTGEIGETVGLNAYQKAKQFLYVEHAKDAVKKGGAQQYGDSYYNRSRLVGAAIRPVKAAGGTPVASYVNIAGKWAQSDANGNALALTAKPQFLSFEGTNFSGSGIVLTYGESYSEMTYSRNINKLSIVLSEEETLTATVASISQPTEDDATAKRVISLTNDATDEVVYYVETIEAPAVPVASLAGKWDITYNGTAYVLNILDDSNCVITKDDNKVNASFQYRFGCFIVDCEALSAVFAVETSAEGSECPFQFTTGGSTITPTVHPKSYEAIYTWSGTTDTELPTWLTLGSKNSLASGSDIKTVKDTDGNVYSYALKFNASWPSTSNPFSATVAEVAIDGGFKTGDRIRVKGYTNADGKNGGLKIWADEETLLGVTSPAINDFKAGESTMDKESIYTFASDIQKVYVCREQGTGTFITDFIIDREKDD